MSLLRLMSIELVMPSNHLILCRSLLLLPSIFPSIRVFSNESILHITWPKYWSLYVSISPSTEYSGLISFRMDCFYLLAVQGLSRVFTNTTIQKHQFFRALQSFIDQLSHSYMTTGKTIALTRWTFVGKIMPLLFNMLSRLVIAFLPRNKRLFISRLQSPSAVILETKKIVCHCCHCFSMCHKVMGLGALVLFFWLLIFKPAFSLSSFTFIKRLFSFSSLPAIRVVSSAYLSLLIFLLAIWIPACASSSPAFRMYSAYKLPLNSYKYNINYM